MGDTKVMLVLYMCLLMAGLLRFTTLLNIACKGKTERFELKWDMVLKNMKHLISIFCFSICYSASNSSRGSRCRAEHL